MALMVGLIVLSSVILVATMRLHHQDGLDASINVDWPVWWLCVAGSYVGLGLIGWWAVQRDLKHLNGTSRGDTGPGPQTD
jgi:hypothetical protein